MSYRSGHHYSDHHHPHDHGRTPPRRPANYAAKTAAIDGDGYTIVHAGKQVRLGPVVFWIVVGTIVLLGMWSAATATYFAFRDDVLTRLIAESALAREESRGGHFRTDFPAEDDAFGAHTVVRPGRAPVFVRWG